MRVCPEASFVPWSLNVAVPSLGACALEPQPNASAIRTKAGARCRFIVRPPRGGRRSRSPLQEAPARAENTRGDLLFRARFLAQARCSTTDQKTPSGAMKLKLGSPNSLRQTEVTADAPAAAMRSRHVAASSVRNVARQRPSAPGRARSQAGSISHSGL